MKNLPLIIVSALLAFSFSSYSQCTIDFSQTQPGIYPDTLPDGMVGQPYSEDITFVMPTDTSGFNFTNFYIQAVSGLPFGLNWVCNAQGNGCNYDPQSNIYGCMNVSGTPIQPGVYPLTVNVIATLQILGDVPATFDTQVDYSGRYLIKFRLLSFRRIWLYSTGYNFYKSKPWIPCLQLGFWKWKYEYTRKSKPSDLFNSWRLYCHI